MKRLKLIGILSSILTLGFSVQSCGASDDITVEEEPKVEPIQQQPTIQPKEKDEDPPKEETIACADESYNVEIKRSDEEIDLSQWTEVWRDDFDYENPILDNSWFSKNGPSFHILSSRWRENAVVVDGVLELQARKESRGGQDWTAGSVWTKRLFGYGYFECRYKYAAAPGTNNSFWLFPQRGGVTGTPTACELDGNEGHFPNEINTNVHVNKDGKDVSRQLNHALGLSPAYAHTFENSIKTKRIRFHSKNGNNVNIREMRVYEANSNCKYPENILSINADNEISGLVNLARKNNVKITGSGNASDRFKIESVADGKNESWASQRDGDKWVEFTWPEEQNIGHVQFINGWQSQGHWQNLVSQYTIEAFIDGDWKELAGYNVADIHNYATDYHVYGIDWSENEIKYYFDNKLIISQPNPSCRDELSIYLSLAILEHAGEITDAIDGTSMKIDWVKYYQKK